MTNHLIFSTCQIQHLSFLSPPFPPSCTQYLQPSPYPDLKPRHLSYSLLIFPSHLLIRKSCWLPLEYSQLDCLSLLLLPPWSLVPSSLAWIITVAYLTDLYASVLA